MSYAKMNRREFFSVAGSVALGSVISAAVTSGTMYYAIKSDVFDLIEDSLSQSRLEDEIEARYGIDVIGGFKDSDLNELEAALKSCEKNFDYFIRYLGLIKNISVVPQDMFVDPGRAGSVDRSRRKTIKLYDIEDYVLIHELAHVLHSKHPKKGEFEGEWVQLMENYPHSAGLVIEGRKGTGCNDLSWKTGRRCYGARHGFVKPYGATKMSEDIATCVEVIFNCLRMHRENRVGSRYLFEYPFGSGVVDTRLVKKFDLLEMYGFISSAERKVMNDYFLPDSGYL
jgi:hypothetical protein